MTEPSTKARELVAAVAQAYFMDGRGKSQISNPAEVRDALLTYIADLEAIAEREQERRDLHE